MSHFVLHEGEEPQASTAPAAFEVERPRILAQVIDSKHGSKQQRPRVTADTFFDEDEEIKSFEGFCAPLEKTLLFYALGVFTLGAVFLLAKWSPRVYIALALKRCGLRDATFVRITLDDGRVDIERVAEVDAPDVPGGVGASARHRLLEYRCVRYFFVPSVGKYVPVPDVPRRFNEGLMAGAARLAATKDWRALEAAADWSPADRSLRYGSNEMRIPVKSVPALIFDEMWHPFYVFQYFSIVVWIAGDAYWTYAVCIFVITWFSIVTSAVEAHGNMRRLADIAYFACEVEALRDGRFTRVPSTALVPGDIVALAPGAVPADCVLLSGEAIVDENMLTGESVPVRKVPYSPTSDGLSYAPDRDAACTLYCGTTVAQAKAPAGAPALAMVCRTRFYSAKGQLLRSILHPREQAQAFVSDSLKFIMVMLAACMGLFVWAAIVLASIGASPARIGVRFLDMITVAVPPALPACLTIATVFSIGRLRKRGVFVTGPHTITVAGQLDAICFDKTGTLTEQGLELQGVTPVNHGAFAPMEADAARLPPELPPLLATCHGLARMGDALVGDPLDQRLFAATGWELFDADEAGLAAAAAVAAKQAERQQQQEDEAAAAGPPPALGWARPPPGGAFGGATAEIVRRFEFSSALQRNGVVVRLAPPAAQQQQQQQRYVLYVKGSPEMLRGLVARDSVPRDFDAVLGGYTREGLRVIALAAGDASAAAPALLAGGTQAALEAAVPLRLVGLAVLANPLRADTAGVIECLQNAQIRCAMVTGDHLRTAISVAHQCRILPPGRPVLLVDAAAAAPAAHSAAAAPSAAAPAAAAAAAAGEEAGAHSPPEGLAALPTLGRAGSSLVAVPSSHSLTNIAEAAAADGGGGGGDIAPTTSSSSNHNPAAAAAAQPIAAAAANEHHHHHGSGSGHVHLSILNADGTVADHPQRGQALAAVMTGDMELAITGKGFDALLASPDAELVQPVLRRGAVFARMTPDNKRDLVHLLGGGLEAAPAVRPLGLHVGFCGDGANDCGALKAAHVGVSLCEAEASVAAPMTSRHQSVASMVTVVSEGRCALVATYQIFQFVVGYAMAQAFSVNLMYTYALQMGNYMFLIQDLFYITVLAALMGYTAPVPTLARVRPPRRVLSLPLLTSTVLQIGVVVAFQLLALFLLRAVGRVPRARGTPDLREVVAAETTALYLVGLAQFVALALVFNKGRPHRRPIWTNVGLVAALCAQVAFLFYNLFSVDAFTTRVVQLVDRQPPLGLTNAARFALLALMLVNLGAAFAAEAASGLAVRGVEAVRERIAASRRGRPAGGAPAQRQSLLLPGGLPARPESGASGVLADGGVAAGIHVPRLTRPGGAELL